MNLQEAVAYIDETPKFTQKHFLQHTKECLKRIGNPERAFRVIHVAGTNGKGSTCAFLASMLQKGGYSCGLFTSPHLVEITERFIINGKKIDEDTFLKAFEQIKDLSVSLEKEGAGHPTYFEMLFLIGMLIFKEAGVQYVVLETGLGGRLDATTAVEDPLCCVITSISMDHMQYLGNTVEEIAGEKAGIIVPGVPVVFDGNDQKAAEVIRKEAEKAGSPWVMIRREDTAVHSNTQAGIDFSLDLEPFKGHIFHIPFIAAYQVMNASLALMTAHILKERIPLELQMMEEGLRDASWEGRMETVLPGVIVDGAHNEDGVEKFVETAEHFQKEHPVMLLFSAVEDKDYKDMIHTIAGRIRLRKVVTTQVGGYRQVPAEVLADIFRENGCTDVEAFASPVEAFRKALEEKTEDSLLFCVGSLYLVGIIKEEIRRNDL